jgi:hypothetical protein
VNIAEVLMADIETVRRIAAALPGAHDNSTAERLTFVVGDKGFAWSFLERVHPKKPRVPSMTVLAVRCLMERKEFLIEAAPEIYFDDPHYRGYAAVLVRLAPIEEAELTALLADACALQASKPKRRRKT